MGSTLADHNTEGLPEGWAFTTLRDACEINPPKASKDSLPADAPVTFVPMPAVDAGDGAIKTPQTKRFSEVRKGFTSFRDNDVIMAKITPCMENGKAAIARNLINGLGFGSTEFHVFRSTGAVLPDFVYHFIRQESYRRAAESEMTGSVGQKRVPQTFLETTEILLPPIAEQIRIVRSLTEVLNAVKASHERLSRVPAILKRFRQAVLAAACSGRLTADWRESGAIGFDSAAHSRVHSEEDESIELPEGWTVTTLNNCCARIIDGNYGEDYPKKEEFTSDGIPFLTSAAIGEDGSILENQVRFISPAKNAILKKAQTTVGDVLFTNRGARVGATTLLTDPRYTTSNIGPQVTRLAPNPAMLLPTYLFLWLRTPFFLSAMNDRNGGSAMNFLNLTVTKELPIWLAPLGEQQEIVRRVKALFELVDHVEARYEEGQHLAEMLTQSILAKAFRGELVPTEAELARREGREYEPASVLLERIKKERVLAQSEKVSQSRRRLSRKVKRV
jgi:type I restriction enzyme S subunit